MGRWERDRARQRQRERRRTRVIMGLNGRLSTDLSCSAMAILVAAVMALQMVRATSVSAQKR